MLLCRGTYKECGRWWVSNVNVFFQKKLQTKTPPPPKKKKPHSRTLFYPWVMKDCRSSFCIWSLNPIYRKITKIQSNVVFNNKSNQYSTTGDSTLKKTPCCKLEKNDTWSGDSVVLKKIYFHVTWMDLNHVSDISIKNVLNVSLNKTFLYFLLSIVITTWYWHNSFEFFSCTLYLIWCDIFKIERPKTSKTASVLKWIETNKV